jgi:hypothetical protein
MWLRITLEWSSLAQASGVRGSWIYLLESCCRVFAESSLLYPFSLFKNNFIRQEP